MLDKTNKLELKKDKRKEKEITPTNILEITNVYFDNPLQDVYTASLPIAGCAWVNTREGVVLIDTLINKIVAQKVKERITDKIKFIIYTHGHMDHVGGAEVFIKDNPEIIANKYLPDRFDKYKMLAAHQARISAQQFNIPEIKTEFNFIYPTKTFLGEMKITLGEKTFELHTSRAETDDVCWIFIPEINTAFIGDLMIGSFPNIGNPWKPTRFALDWVKTLEEIKEIRPKFIFCSGAGVLYKGNRAIKALDANIEVIRSLHDQIIDGINQDIHITEMIHTIKIPDHLKKSPFLRLRYSRLEFFVYNVYRWYHGYFDHNPAHLLPRPEKDVMEELYNLIGDSEKILNRAKELLDQNQAQLALQILDVLIQVKPDDMRVYDLRIKLLNRLAAEDNCLMSRNLWYYFINQDKAYLKSLDQDYKKR